MSHIFLLKGLAFASVIRRTKCPREHAMKWFQKILATIAIINMTVLSAFAEDQYAADKAKAEAYQQVLDEKVGKGVYRVEYNTDKK